MRLPGVELDPTISSGSQKLTKRGMAFAPDILASWFRRLDRLQNGFSGELRARSGLIHYGFRTYSPAIGKWTSSDPAQKSGSERSALNFYLMVDGNPATNRDHDGLMHLEWRHLPLLAIGLARGVGLGTEIAQIVPIPVEIAKFAITALSPSRTFIRSITSPLIEIQPFKKIKIFEEMARRRYDLIPFTNQNMLFLDTNHYALHSLELLIFDVERSLRNAEKLLTDPRRRSDHTPQQAIRIFLEDPFQFFGGDFDPGHSLKKDRGLISMPAYLSRTGARAQFSALRRHAASAYQNLIKDIALILNIPTLARDWRKLHGIPYKLVEDKLSQMTPHEIGFTKTKKKEMQWRMHIAFSTTPPNIGLRKSDKNSTVKLIDLYFRKVLDTECCIRWQQHVILVKNFGNSEGIRRMLAIANADAVNPYVKNYIFFGSGHGDPQGIRRVIGDRSFTPSDYNLKARVHKRTVIINPGKHSWGTRPRSTLNSKQRARSHQRPGPQQN
jgi:RHS repeat-associated protein